MSSDRHHNATAVKEWTSLIELISNRTDRGKPRDITLDGRSLTTAAVVAVARYTRAVAIDSNCIEHMQASHQALNHSIDQGSIIYGVNTGFGGSADVRTKQTEKLQRVLVRELHYGIPVDVAEDEGSELFPEKDYMDSEHATIVAKLSSALLDQDDYIPCMPRTWTRASLLIRINSLVRGHSAIRPGVVQDMIRLLEADILPKIPMHGSISASGDLSPLSYIAGTLQGKRTITCWPIQGEETSKRPLTAAAALRQHSIAPTKFAAKESLAIVNGTAVSCASAALALYDAHGLAVMSQILTAMSVEALRGTAESFDPIFAEVRPHSGQIESSHNIFTFLEGSRLTRPRDASSAAGDLAQDRYSIRTASQWIGPALEDLMLAHDQISVELNSTTDNPLFDEQGRCVSGGNFQAKSVAAAVEKIRQSAQTIGRLHFTQCTELVNPDMNRGLAPNLVIEDPSTSFIFKGMDLMVSALQSELGFLANPVTSHVQNADMGNQALNSLALISARYTHTALEVLSRLMACHLLSVCQAIDLRVLNLLYLENVESEFKNLTLDILTKNCESTANSRLMEIVEQIWLQLQSHFDQTARFGTTSERFAVLAKRLKIELLEHIVKSAPTPGLDISGDQELRRAQFLTDLGIWSNKMQEMLEDGFILVRDAYLKHGEGRAQQYVGRASGIVYSFVRRELGVPFLHTPVIDSRSSEDTSDIHTREGSIRDEPVRSTVGTFVGKIYRAFRSGAFVVPMMACLQVHRQY